MKLKDVGEEYMKGIQNPLRLIYDIQNKFSAKNKIPKSPLYVDVEPTNICNFSCRFCVRQQMKRKLGYMTLNQFRLVAKSTKDANAKVIRFAGWGEPFLNKEVYEMIRIVNSLNMISHVTTNGTLIDVNRLLDSGLRSIYFSMQGLNEKEYSKLRNTKKYPILVKNINQLVKERNKRNLKYPYIQINTSITDETKKEQQKFLDKWEKVVDGISISYTWLKRVENKERVKLWLKRTPNLTRYFRCNEVRCKLTVHWDGTVTPCCEDYDEVFNLGNVFTMSLQKIWDSPTAKSLRIMLTEYGNQDMFVLCKDCELCHTFRGGFLK